MIVDSIQELGRYNIPMREEIVRFLKTHQPFDFSVPEIEIKGRELFVRPSVYTTRTPSEGKFETHERYADLQYVVEGVEVMQTAWPDALAPLSAYDSKSDCRFFGADAGTSDIVVPEGCFAVFFPGEAHRPCCHYQGAPGRVKKLGFKIRMNDIRG